MWYSSQQGQQRQPQNAGEEENTSGNIYVNGINNTPIYADISPHAAGDYDKGASPNIDDGVVYSQLQKPNTRDVYATVSR